MALPGLRALNYVVSSKMQGVEGIYEEVFGDQWQEVSHTLCLYVYMYDAVSL